MENKGFTLKSKDNTFSVYIPAEGEIIKHGYTKRVLALSYIKHMKNFKKTNDKDSQRLAISYWEILVSFERCVNSLK